MTNFIFLNKNKNATINWWCKRTFKIYILSYSYCWLWKIKWVLKFSFFLYFFIYIALTYTHGKYEMTKEVQSTRVLYWKQIWIFVCSNLRWWRNKFFFCGSKKKKFLFFLWNKNNSQKNSNKTKKNGKICMFFFPSMAMATCKTKKKKGTQK